MGRPTWPSVSGEAGTIGPRPRAGVMLCFVSAGGPGLAAVQGRGQGCPIEKGK